VKLAHLVGFITKKASTVSFASIQKSHNFFKSVMSVRYPCRFSFYSVADIGCEVSFLLLSKSLCSVGMYFL